MADQETNWILKLVNEITAPVKEVTAGVKLMEQAIENVDKEVVKMGNDSEKAFKKSNDSLRILAAQAGAQAITNLGQPLLDGAQGAYAYDASLKELSAITGVVGDNLDLIGGNARQSAKDLGGDAAESVKSYTLLLSKLAPEIAENPKALDMMGHSIGLLGETMHGDLIGATNAASSAMNQFGVDLTNPEEAAKQMDLMLNQMVSSAKVGSQEVDQVAAALDASGAVAKNANVSFAETNGALQVLGKFGKEGAEGGVALRNVLSILGKEEFLPKEVRKQLQGAGVDVSILADKNRSLADRLTELKKLAGKDALLGAMFSQENTVAITGLLGNVDLLKQYTNDIVNDQTALADMAGTMGTSYQEQKDRIVSYFDDLKLSIYGATGSMLPFIDVGLDGVLKMVNLAPGILAMVNMVKLLKEATVFQTAAQWLLNIAMDANSIGLVIAAITALIAYVSVMIVYWDDFGAAMSLLLGPIGLVIGAFKSIYDHWDSIVQAFQTDGIVAGLMRIGMVLLDVVLKPLQQVLEIIANIDPTGLAQKGVDSIKAFRESQSLVTSGENKQGTSLNTNNTNDPLWQNGPDNLWSNMAANHDFKQPQLPGYVKSPSAIGSGDAKGGNSGAGKIINMTLNVINNFNVKESSFMKNKEEIVDYVVGRMNDSLKDALITAG